MKLAARLSYWHWCLYHDARASYLKDYDENGHVVGIGDGGHDAEDAVEEEARNAHEEEEVVEERDGVMIDIEATELTTGQKGGKGHEDQQGGLGDEVDPDGRDGVVLVAEGQEEEEDADYGGDEDEEAGEETPIGRVTVDVDDELVPAPQVVGAALVLVSRASGATRAPTGIRLALAHILPHDEPNTHCTYFQGSKIKRLECLEVSFHSKWSDIL